MSKDKENKKHESTEIQTRNTGRALEAMSPFSFVRRFAEDMERFFDDFNGYRFPSLFERESLPFRKEFANVTWVPQIEVMQHNGDLRVRADLPGLTKDSVKVELTDEALTISGERKEEKEEKREGYFSSERSYGTFYRRIPLPQGVDTDKATATFTNGVLEVTIQVPKSEVRGRKLEIKEGQEPAKAKTATVK
jgi:HSP20 family protein